MYPMNLSAPAIIAAAAKKVVSGIRISLDWPLDPAATADTRLSSQDIKRRRVLECVVERDTVYCESEWAMYRPLASPPPPPH